VYLRYIFERLPLAKKDADFRALLPQNIDRSLLPGKNVSLTAAV
jgi:hypothetical protein